MADFPTISDCLLDKQPQERCWIRPARLEFLRLLRANPKKQTSRIRHDHTRRRRQSRHRGASGLPSNPGLRHHRPHHQYARNLDRRVIVQHCQSAVELHHSAPFRNRADILGRPGMGMIIRHIRTARRFREGAPAKAPQLGSSPGQTQSPISTLPFCAIPASRSRSPRGPRS